MYLKAYGGLIDCHMGPTLAERPVRGLVCIARHFEKTASAIEIFVPPIVRRSKHETHVRCSLDTAEHAIPFSIYRDDPIFPTYKPISGTEMVRLFSFAREKDACVAVADMPDGGTHFESEDRL
jgi:hypothetical protein